MGDAIVHSVAMEAIVHELVDKCIDSDDLHLDIAVLTHTMYKDKYRFARDTWYVLQHEWVRAHEGLQPVLTGIICAKFFERAIHWTREATMCADVQSKLCTDKALALNKIAFRLRKGACRAAVIKKCKALFADDRKMQLNSVAYRAGLL